MPAVRDMTPCILVNKY